MSRFTYLTKPPAVMDWEVYKDYSLCKLRRIDTGAVRAFEAWPGNPLNRQLLAATLNRVTLITFHGNSYDVPISAGAIAGFDCAQLKALSDMIIQGGLRPWQVERQCDIRIPQLDHIDLIEVVPGMVSLKVYMGRLHCRKMQDLPIEHDQSITPDLRPLIYTYNDNDLDGTEALFLKFEDQIKLRVHMSREYGIDVRSKSDAQIAETIIKRKLTDIGVPVTKGPTGQRTFKYQFPAFFRGQTGPVVSEVMRLVAESDFVVDDKGYVKMPSQLASANIKIGQGTYRMGIGGLHSSEQSVMHVADDEWMILDRDVASYYPAIIINCGLYPKHLGPAFLDVYRRIRDQRIEAKRAGHKTTADTLKIVLNGSFGKFGSPYSILYSPDLLIQTTVTGQVALLMLIEWLETHGLQVISANTDGIVIKCRRSERSHLDAIFAHWETVTGFETEETQYRLLASRDVNSYIALKEKGGIKLKGAYAEPEPVASSWPSPHNQVCVTAACNYLEHGIAPEWTVALSNDIRDFIEVRNVTGGAKWREQYLGRAVRWYHTADGEPILRYKPSKTGNYDKVAGTDLSKPLMLMDGTMPADLDRSWYVNEAYNILAEIGAKPRVNPNAGR